MRSLTHRKFAKPLGRSAGESQGISNPDGGGACRKAHHG